MLMLPNPSSILSSCLGEIQASTPYSYTSLDIHIHLLNAYQKQPDGLGLFLSRVFHVVFSLEKNNAEE